MLIGFSNKEKIFLIKDCLESEIYSIAPNNITKNKVKKMRDSLIKYFDIEHNVQKYFKLLALKLYDQNTTMLERLFLKK